jgi:hypothetical protein
LSQGRTKGAGPAPEDGEESVLRRKYLDYCSARLAEVLLRLSADEMYVLADAAAREAGIGDARSLSYDRIVRLATERLSRQTDLPTFEQWTEAYRKDPDRFEGDLLGLWESDLEATGQSGTGGEG